MTYCYKLISHETSHETIRALENPKAWNTKLHFLLTFKTFPEGLNKIQS